MVASPLRGPRRGRRVRRMAPDAMAAFSSAAVMVGRVFIGVGCDRVNCSTNGAGSPPPCGGLRILGGDHGSGQTPVDELRGAGTVLQLIGAGDPFDLTGLQVRAHGKGEAHRVVCFGSHSVDPPPASAGRGWTVLELDRFEVGSGIRDVILLNPIHKGLQDLQNLIPIAATAEQGDGKVQGHG